MKPLLEPRYRSVSNLTGNETIQHELISVTKEGEPLGSPFLYLSLGRIREPPAIRRAGP